VLLLAAGGECFDDIRTLAADEGLCRLLARQMPSADTCRHFLYEFHDEALIERAKQLRPAGTVAFIPAESELLAGLARVNLALVHAVAARGKGTRATLDHDATIQESHKREALPHYKGGRGYQPACIYWAEQDLVIGDEYRDGNVPAAMGNLPLIQKAFQSLPDKVKDRFFQGWRIILQVGMDATRRGAGRRGGCPPPTMRRRQVQQVFLCLLLLRGLGDGA